VGGKLGITRTTAICIALCVPASAAVKYWDVNGATTGAGGANPAGIWDQGTTANWSLGAAGDLLTTTFASGDAAVFSAGNDAAGSYIINVSGPVTASGGIIVKDGTVILGGSGSIGIAAATVTVTNGATLVFGTASKFLASAGNALVLDNGTVRITNAVGTALWSATGNLRIGSGGATFEITAGGIANYTGANGITLTPGTPAAMVTKTGPGEFRPQTCAFTRLVVNQGLWRISGTGGLETGFGAVPATFSPDALSIDGGAVGTLASLVTPSTRGITLGSAGATFVVSAPWTIQSIISGSGSLALNGNGFAGSPSQLLTLAGANTYEGNTVINLGVLSAGDDANLGLPPSSPRANAITFGGGILNINHTFTLHPNRGIQLAAAGIIDVSTGQTLTCAGVISANANTFSLTKRAGGTLTLGGTNSFGGGAGGDFIITGGTVNLDDDRAAGAGKIVVTPALPVTLRNTVASTIVPNPIVLNPGSAPIDVLAPAGNRFALAGPISGTAAVTRGEGGGEGTVILSGSNTQWSGGLEHRGGALELGHLYSLGTGPFSITGTKATLTRIQATVDLTSGGAPTNSVNLGTNLVVSGTHDLELAGPVDMGTVTRTLTVDNSKFILSGPISGGGLVKDGPGSLLLSGENNYAGPTVVQAGTLQVGNFNGSATGSGAITVAAGALLKGQGTVAGPMDLSGTVAPGEGPGTLWTGDQTWAGGANYLWELRDAAGSAGTDWDVISIKGTLAIAATSNAKFVLKIKSLATGGADGFATNFSPASDYEWPIVSTSGGIAGFDPDAFILDASGFSNAIAGGRFLLAVANGTNLVLHFRSNHAPVAADDTVSRPRGVGMKIRKADLLANDTDAESGPPVFLGVSPLSTNGAVVTADGLFVYYQPPSNDPVSDVVDRFSYMVGDGFLTATGQVIVNIEADVQNPVPSVVGYARAPDGNLSVTFAGVPGRAYLVQAANGLSAPIVWQSLTNNLDGGFLFTAGTNGLWTHTDLNSTNFGIRFYRSALP